MMETLKTAAVAVVLIAAARWAAKVVPALGFLTKWL